MAFSESLSEDGAHHFYCLSLHVPLPSPTWCALLDLNDPPGLMIERQQLECGDVVHGADHVGAGACRHGIRYGGHENHVQYRILPRKEYL
jgi:hypothetical protein